MTTAPRPALERDPVKLDPKHYQVELETDRLRIVRIRYGPKEKSPMHQHLPGVGVMITDGDFKFTYPDGNTEEIHKKAGEFLSFEEPWEHQPESLANKPFEALLIELKPASHRSTQPSLERDAVRVDPKHYKVELETDQLRVIRMRYGPKERSPMHQHLPGVAVMLSNCEARFTYPDGRTEEIHKRVGEVLSSEERWEHQPESLTDKPFEALLVELKK